MDISRGNIYVPLKRRAKTFLMYLRRYSPLSGLTHGLNPTPPAAHTARLSTVQLRVHSLGQTARPFRRRNGCVGQEWFWSGVCTAFSKESISPGPSFNKRAFSLGPPGPVLPAKVATCRSHSSHCTCDVGIHTCTCRSVSHGRGYGPARPCSRLTRRFCISAAWGRTGKRWGEEGLGTCFAATLFQSLVNVKTARSSFMLVAQDGRCYSHLRVLSTELHHGPGDADIVQWDTHGTFMTFAVLISNRRKQRLPEAQRLSPGHGARQYVGALVLEISPPHTCALDNPPAAFKYFLFPVFKPRMIAYGLFSDGPCSHF